MREFNFQQNVERSLSTKFKASIYAKFLRAIEDYQLISPGDVIGVAVSGGKDSLLMAKLLQEAKKRGGLDFDLKFITMNPGFSDENLALLKSNCEKLGIDIIIEDSRIFDIVGKIAGESPCYLCARMRRGFLYALAKKHGCNKLALGHHFDDVIETTLLNLFYAGTFGTMMPKARSENFEGMELIRPLYLVKEADTIRFAKYHGIETMDCGCTIACHTGSSKRAEMKQLIESMRQQNPNVDISIFRAAEKVNLHDILGYYDDTDQLAHKFPDNY